LGCCMLAIWTARNVLASRVGRELNAVRLSPHAAQALGVSVHRVKLAAFALSAAYGGVAGGLQAIVVGFIDPVEFGVSAALRQITFIVVGGMGSVAGSVIGAAVLSAMPEALRPVKEYSDVIYTLMLLGFLIFVPHGLVTVWYVIVRRMRRHAPAGRSSMSSRSRSFRYWITCWLASAAIRTCRSHTPRSQRRLRIGARTRPCGGHWPCWSASISSRIATRSQPSCRSVY